MYLFGEVSFKLEHESFVPSIACMLYCFLREAAC